MRLLSMLALIMILSSGCGNAAPKNPAGIASSTQALERSSARDAVYTITQFDKIKAARNTEEKIKKISEGRQSDLKDVSE